MDLILLLLCELKTTIVFLCLFIGGCTSPSADIDIRGWSISIVPSSIRVDPLTTEIIEQRFSGVEPNRTSPRNLLEENWIYDGEQVSLGAARGEYVSFQLVITNHSDSALKGIQIEMLPFKGQDLKFKTNPELFLEWAVEVKTPSTGYPKASLGKGWYPDALIPLENIQMDSSKVHRRWVYPLELPDFNNRIENQQAMIIWVDQYVPFSREDAPHWELHHLSTCDHSR